jgi:hypothetical protein
LLTNSRFQRAIQIWACALARLHDENQRCELSLGRLPHPPEAATPAGPVTWPLLLRSGHHAVAHGAVPDCSCRTEAATAAPSAPKTRASTNAGVGSAFTNDVLVATSASRHVVDLLVLEADDAEDLQNSGLRA